MIEQRTLMLAIAATCAVALTGSGASPVVAQSAAQTELPELVVTATRVPTAPDRIGSSVTVISAEEIERVRHVL